MPTASAREFGFRFDLRTKGGQEAARIFGQMATSLNKLSSSAVGTRAHIATIAKNMATLSAQTDLLSKKFDRLGKSITTSTSSNQTANIYRMAASLGAMGFVANRVGDGIIRTFTNVGKSLFEVSTSFEYIKAGLDFAFGFRSQEMMTKAMNIAQETNISTREVLDVTRSLGVLKINPFSEMLTKKGQIQSSLQSLADLAALVPQQGMEGALFAIRNALSGQWRSLQMRFDIPLNIIDQIRSKITATMDTQQRFDAIMQGITDNFGGMMKSVSHTTKFYVDNIKDVVTNLAYDVFQKASQQANPFFERVFNYFKDLRNNKEAITKISDTFISMAKAVAAVASKLFSVVKFITTFVAAHPTVTKLSAAFILLFGVVSKVIGLIGFMGSSLIFAAQGTEVFAKGMFRANTATRTFAMTWKGIAWTTGITAAIALVVMLVNKLNEARVAKENFINYKGEALSGPGMGISANTGAIAAKQATELFNFPTLNRNDQTAPFLNTANIGKSQQGAYDSLFTSFAGNLRSTLANRQQNIAPKKWAEIAADLKGLGLYDYVTKENQNLTIPSTINKARLTALSQKLSGISKESQGASGYGRFAEEQKQEVSNFYQQYLPYYNAKTEAREKYINATLAEGQKLNPTLTREQAESGLNWAAGTFRRKSIEDAMSGLKGTALGTVSQDVVRGFAGSYGKTGRNVYPGYMAEYDTQLPNTYKEAADLFTQKFRLPGGAPAMLQLLQSAGVGKDRNFNPIAGQYTQNPGALDEQQASAKIRELLTVQAQEKNTDLMDDILRALLKLDPKLAAVVTATEGTEDNTKKTEEMLPPLFREIFDDFTRRSVRSEMGANSLYSRLAMAR